MKLQKQIITIVTFSILCIFVACKKQKETLPTEDNYPVIVEQVFSTIDSLFNTDKETAFCFARDLLKSDTLVNNPTLYYDVVNKIGVLKMYIGEADSALFYYKKASDFWKSDSSIIGRKHYGALLFNIAYLYKEKGEVDTAICLLNKAADFSADFNNNYYGANIYLVLANIYQSQGEYCNALESIEKSIHLCHINSDSVYMISSLQAYADLYTNCYLFDEAKIQFENVMNYQNHFTPYSKYCYFNGIGRMYYLDDDYFNAKTAFLETLKLTDKNDVISYMIILSNLSETYLLLDELDSAKYYLDILGGKHNGLNSFALFKYNYNSLLGEYYCKKSQYLLAKKAFSISDSIEELIKVDKTILKLHKKRKARFYASANNFAEAFSELTEYNELDKSLLVENSQKQVAGLKYKFERDTTIISQRKDIEINKQQIESYKYRQVLLIGSIFVLLLFVGLIIIFFQKVRALNHEKSIREIAALKMESIRGRISPHFVFNVLNNIWAIIDDKEHAKAQFNNLMNMIRHSLINTEKIAISLNDEIDFVKSFIDLQKLMMNNNLDVHWNIEKGIDLTQLIPGMILQIPVENAIKHGLAPKKDNRKLQIEIKKESGYLQFIITDNGAGLRPSIAPTKGTGTGLKVLTNTIHLLNQINKEEMSYEIFNRFNEEEPGTKVIIKIPLFYNYDLN